MPLPSYWRALGPARPRALVFLHGFLGQGADWLPQMQALGSLGWCLAPDLPGHGQHPPGPCDPASTLKRLRTDLQASGVQEICLLGYSLGGRLALAWALEHPADLRALVLESASPGLAEATARAARRQQDAERAAALLAEGVPAFVARWYQAPLWDSLRSSPAFAGLVAQRGQQSAAGLARSLREAGTGSQASLWERLPALAVPTLCLSGQQDAKFQALAAAMTQHANPAYWQAQSLPGGHNLHLENPAAWLAAVRPFLQAKGPSEEGPRTV
ncbi:MAG: 2-succinyl-6-hydroxy-2,4-cyclohexadiene-1-carboxylate synthase [Candidatus Sericytochromatia bacterium]